MTRRKPLTLNAGKIEQLPDNGAIAGVAPVRQTVLLGSVDSSGFPSALSVGSGLAVTLTATGTAFLLAFAGGFDSNGAIDYLGQFTTNQSFSGLTASTTCFLYVDRNISTGALTTGFSLLIPAYSTIAPTSPATDQHWFDLSTFTLKRWSGSAWVAFQRVFVGEALTGASTVTSVATYTYRRFYQSLWLPVSANTTYNFTHNLGIPMSTAQPLLIVSSSIAGNDSDAMVVPTLTFTQAMVPPGTYYGYQNRNQAAAESNRKVYSLATTAYVAINGSNSWVTTGYYKVTLSGGW